MELVFILGKEFHVRLVTFRRGCIVLDQRGKMYLERLVLVPMVMPKTSARQMHLNKRYMPKRPASWAK